MKTLLAICCLLAVTPVTTLAAETSAMTKSASHMSKADMRRIKSCKAMASDAMMKNTMCMRMVKLHPEEFPANENSH